MPVIKYVLLVNLAMFKHYLVKLTSIDKIIPIMIATVTMAIQSALETKRFLPTSNMYCMPCRELDWIYWIVVCLMHSWKKQLWCYTNLALPILNNQHLNDCFWNTKLTTLHLPFKHKLCPKYLEWPFLVQFFISLAQVCQFLCKDGNGSNFWSQVLQERLGQDNSSSQ